MIDEYIIITIAIISIMYCLITQNKAVVYPFVIIALGVVVYTIFTNTRSIEQFNPKPVSEFDPTKQAPISDILPEKSEFSLLVNTLGFEHKNATDSIKPTNNKLTIKNSKNGPSSNSIETNNGIFTIAWICKAQSLSEGENSFMKIFGSIDENSAPNALEIRYIKNSNEPNAISVLYSNQDEPFEFSHEILNHTTKYHSFVLTVDPEQEEINLHVDKIPLGSKDISNLPIPEMTMSNPITINKDATFDTHIKLISIFNGRILPSTFFNWYDKYKTSHSSMYQDLYKRSEKNYTNFINEFQCPFPKDVCEKCSNITHEQWADQLKVLRNGSRECLRAIYCHCKDNTSQECVKWKPENLRKVVQKDLGFDIPEDSKSWFDDITCDDDKDTSFSNVFENKIPDNAKPFICYYNSYKDNYDCYYTDGSKAYPDFDNNYYSSTQSKPKPADKPFKDNQLDLTPNQDVSASNQIQSLTESDYLSSGDSQKKSSDGKSDLSLTNYETKNTNEEKSKENNNEITPESYKKMISNYRQDNSSKTGFFKWLFGI